MEAGATVAIGWHGRRVDAFVPALIPRAVDLPERVVRPTERVATSLQRVDDRRGCAYSLVSRCRARQPMTRVPTPARLVIPGGIRHLVTFSTGEARTRDIGAPWKTPAVTIPLIVTRICPSTVFDDDV